LREGFTVELDGLGSFRKGASDDLTFIPDTRPRVFIAYVVEDRDKARRLADAIEAAGMRPWLDQRKLLVGQDWRGCIERAIDGADFFVACFSNRSLRKRGQFQTELRTALRCAERMPLDDLFLLPVRFDDCRVPERIQAQIQYVDLFPEWGEGIEKLLRSIRDEMDARDERRGQ
jgi:hypothetical protein